MAAEKKYYWLKLSEDFFHDKAIKKLRKLAGGDTYTIIYLKMLLKSMKDNGFLYYDGIEETFPDEVALDIDEDPDNVKVTMEFLIRAGLLTKKNEDEAVLEQLPGMVGSETGAAQAKRRQRARKAAGHLTDGHCPDNVATMSPRVQKCPPEIEIEKEIDTELEIEKDLEKSKKQRKKKAAASALDDADLAIRDALEAFIDNRKKLRKPMTDRAVEMLLKRLDTLAPDDYETQRKMLENATLNGWQNVYPLKEEKKRPAQSGEEYLMRLARGEEE